LAFPGNSKNCSCRKFYFVEGEGRSRKHKLSFLGILSILKSRKLKLIANFFTQYRKLYALEAAGDGFVRSTWYLHMDLNRCGFKIVETKGMLPYWEGHEREDIVEARNAFINSFLGRRDNYYVPEEAEEPKWIAPI